MIMHAWINQIGDYIVIWLNSRYHLISHSLIINNAIDMTNREIEKSMRIYIRLYKS